jgi:hypothetical protein
LVTDTAGYYSLDPLRGSYIACAEMDNYNSKCDTLQLAPGIKSNHDFYLDFNVGNQRTTQVETFTIMPNPFSDKLTTQFYNQSAGNVKIILTSATGGNSWILKESYFDAGTHTLTLNPQSFSGTELPSGVYILNIITSAAKYEQRVIKVL